MLTQIHRKLMISGNLMRVDYYENYHVIWYTRAMQSRL